MLKTPSVTIVVPMFNERENIEHALACATRALERYADGHEIVVVDDASTDDSVEIVSAFAAADPRIRLLRHTKNRRLGGTLRTGFAAARMDVVLYMDADLPYDPDILGRALAALEVSRADVIAGYRLDRTGEGALRAIYSYVYNTVIGVLFGWPHRDINFSFKLLRREVLEAVELRAEGSLIDAELVVKAKNLGFVIQQIGLDYFPRSRGISTLSSPTVIFKILGELCGLFWDMRHPKRRTPATSAQPEAAELAAGAATAHRAP